MRVLLWGDYDQGNFGDDAMALVFGRALVGWGHEVLVAGARASLVAEIGDVTHVPRVRDAADAAVDVVVVGGGGILSRQPGHWRFRGTRRAAERRYRELADLLHAVDRPAYAVSIGGDGATDPAQLTDARRDVVTSPALRGVTLRLEDDLALFAPLDVEAEQAPDVLYRLVGEDLAGPADPRGGGGIGLNLKRWEARRFRRVVAGRTDAALVAVRTHTPDSGHTYESVAGTVRTIAPRTVDGFVADLADLDLLVTSKLHVGVVALTLGVPVVCAAPPAKAALEMRHLGLDNVARDEAELDDLLRAWQAGDRDRFLPDPDALTRARSGAARHLDRLRSWLDAAGSATGSGAGPVTPR